MKIQACKNGHLSAEFRIRCAVCGEALSERSVDGEGVVISSTSLLVVQHGFQPPVHLSIVRLSEGITVLCRSDVNLKPGDAVTVREAEGHYECFSAD